MEKKNTNIAEEEKVIMSFLDENGEKVDFEAVAKVYLKVKQLLTITVFYFSAY